MKDALLYFPSIDFNLGFLVKLVVHSCHVYCKGCLVFFLGTVWKSNDNLGLYCVFLTVFAFHSNQINLLFYSN